MAGKCYGISFSADGRYMYIDEMVWPQSLRHRIGVPIHNEAEWPEAMQSLINHAKENLQ